MLIEILVVGLVTLLLNNLLFRLLTGEFPRSDSPHFYKMSIGYRL